MAKQKIVIGIFGAEPPASKAVERLEKSGFNRDKLSVLMSDDAYGLHFSLREQTKVPEGAAVGGTIGGALGGLALGLSAVASVVIPGVGLLATGPLVAALAGVGAGAATGGLVGALVGAGLPEHEAKLHERGVKEGKILVAVHTEDEPSAKIVEGILEASGAEKVKHQAGTDQAPNRA